MNEDLLKYIDLLCLRCIECGEHLDEYYEHYTKDGLVVKSFRFIVCSNCGKKYDGYEYEILNGELKNFKLKEK